MHRPEDNEDHRNDDNNDLHRQGMGIWDRRQPAKGEVLIMGVIALLLLLNTLSMVFEGGPRDAVLFWIVVALDLAALGYCFYAYRRAAKMPLRPK